MKHVQKGKKSAVCGSRVRNGDVLVLAALESDCDDCRERLMVASHLTKGCETRETPKWEAQPWTSSKKRDY